jgi:hypothetical protein
MTAMNIMGGLNNDLGTADASTALENVMSAVQQALLPNAQKVSYSVVSKSRFRFRNLMPKFRFRSFRFRRITSI